MEEINKNNFGSALGITGSLAEKTIKEFTGDSNSSPEKLFSCIDIVMNKTARNESYPNAYLSNKETEAMFINGIRYIVENNDNIDSYAIKNSEFINSVVMYNKNTDKIIILGIPGKEPVATMAEALVQIENLNLNSKNDIELLIQQHFGSKDSGHWRAMKYLIKNNDLEYLIELAVDCQRFNIILRVVDNIMEYKKSGNVFYYNEVFNILYDINEEERNNIFLLLTDKNDLSIEEFLDHLISIDYKDLKEIYKSKTELKEETLGKFKEKISCSSIDYFPETNGYNCGMQSTKNLFAELENLGIKVPDYNNIKNESEEESQTTTEEKFFDDSTNVAMVLYSYDLLDIFSDEEVAEFTEIAVDEEFIQKIFSLLETNYNEQLTDEELKSMVKFYINELNSKNENQLSSLDTDRNSYDDAVGDFDNCSDYDYDYSGNDYNDYDNSYGMTY